MRKRILFMVLQILVVGGCAKPKSDFEADLRRQGWEWTDVPESKAAWAIAIADERAQQVLDEHNSRPDSVNEQFTLDQYTRTPRYRTMRPDGVSTITIYYELTVPVNFLGHPQHFSIQVNESDSSTKVMGGL